MRTSIRDYNPSTNPAVPFMLKKNVQKRRARPKPSIANSGDDHNLGLWIDYELLRRHQGRPPHILIHDPVATTNNRYLELADLCLGKAKKKNKDAAAE